MKLNLTMMKSILNKYFLAALYFVAILFFCSCEKQLNNARVNPEAITSAIPSSFLSPVLYGFITTVELRSHDINNEFMQVDAARQETDQLHRYVVNPSVYNEVWNELYPVLNNNEAMLQSAIANADVNYQAIAYTLKALMFSILSDTYGDVPFREALQGDSALAITPAFDKQQLIYDSLIGYLDRADSLFNTSATLSGTLSNDILYGGNLVKWKKFANVLQLRLLMRVQKKGSRYTDKIKYILSNPSKYPLMQNQADGAAIYYTNVAPNTNPFATLSAQSFNTTNWAFAHYFINTLNTNKDPRLAIWATKKGGYIGIPSGYPTTFDDTLAGITYSTFQDSLRQSSLLGSILQYAEQEFMLAEFALNGYSTDNPQTHYLNGLNASITYWGGKATTTFLTSTPIAYNGTLQQIITQKYFALFTNDLQQWFEYRRTGYPILDPIGSGAVNNGKLPVRIPYPTTEQIYNQTSYNNELKIIGTDDINTLVWWQQP